MKRFCLVLGASGAIGSATAKRLAEDGYSLYLQHHHTSVALLLNELTERYPNQEFMPIQCDLTSVEAAQHIAQNVFDIEAIVVASGHALYQLVDDTTSQEMLKLWQVHVQTPIEVIQKLASKMRRHEKSYIVMIGSIWGEAGGAGEVLYSTVKGAVHSFVKAYAQEVAYNGMTVNAVSPGMIQTRMNGHLSEEEMAEVVAEIPMNRPGQPEEVANAVSFLVSGSADYMTGQILRVNGGWYI